MVVGHRLDKDTDKMDLFFEDGTILSIGKWSGYSMKLGKDWVIATKKRIEKEAGQNINLEG